MTSKPRILITGGTGYIGSNVLKKLKEDGYEVENIVRGNFLDSLFNEFKPDIALHFATHFTNSDDIVANHLLEESNIRFGMELAYYCSLYKVKTFVNFTTFQLHYNNEEYNPVNLYAATKKAFMDILEYYHQTEKFRVVNVELNSVYGPWDKRKKLIPLLLEAMESGKEIQLSSPYKIVDLVNIKFVYDSILNILTGLNTDKYVMLSGEEISLIQLVGYIEDISKKIINIKWNSKIIEREIMNPVGPIDFMIKDDELSFDYYINEIIKEGQYYANLS